MGIRFLDSLLMLLTAAAGVGAAYFAGHALSSDAGWAWITAAALVVVAVFIGAITSRRVRGYAREKGEELNL